ncbi:glycosyl hydrolase 115 family protein [Mucilaginibacter auburnensis]|uniref:Glycosyl hydrolase family 115 (Putative glucuronidase) n=1 Tax=Mucilaginibacter auburnensis TaxID=1457233 RepID=A0A2H9VU04_9SPHI|nr:glycosyl hydrolase 115 family protein [Mucilaginibacter auburnensis]PJJ84316.1 glycosyl hydrolase family 115 (putative glucuronidase) [Mucilaginibacter auburnensis]
MKIDFIKSKLLFAFNLLAVTALAQGPGHASYVTEKGGKGYFKLVANGTASPILVSEQEWPGVKRAVNSFVTDVNAVTGAKPGLATTTKAKQLIIVGTLGKNQWIDQLVKQKKLNVTGIAGKWETYLVQPVANPFPGVTSALVIAGSDKRGTIYGVYDLSAQIGVSPWYWYADVAPKTKKALYVAPGRHTDGTPAVKYRGIFINDEAPAFSGWAKAKFGGVNHQLYEHMFELILRLKGNYLWPAMWGNAFNDDDKLNPVLADEYGVVMGTSHHEPMDRAQQEWKRYGKGKWNYEENKQGLQDFWRKGIENMGNKETIVTIGMRGDGDEPMTKGSNIELLENIVKDQRQIISDVLKKKPEEVPQMWALYKEVQDYYDKGMRVPDDVTLLLCDDNWGNIRKLPSLTDKPRKGGYGIYYHFDYVGGPRNYKWLNTSTIAKTWEQMNLAYEYNARQIWIVNVGDLKPMEYPISFFLDFAWNPKRWPANKLPQYATEWASQQFGSEHATQIASMLTRYTRYNQRRKPESLNQDTYNLINYNEFARVVADYNALKDEAEKLAAIMPAQHKDSFYELVLYPIQACATLNEMYFEVAKNRYYAQQKNAVEANKAADKVKELYAKDADISKYYNMVLADGKWNHMADQQHIGYTSWQQPNANIMPKLTILKPDSAKNTALLPVEQDGSTPKVNGLFNDKYGHIAIEAEHYTRAVKDKSINWVTIPDHGNVLSGVTPWPVAVPRLATPGGSTAHLEYDVDLKSAGDVSITAYITPTLDFRNGGDGLFYAISIDDEAPQKVDIASKVDGRDWSQMVLGNVRKLTTKHKVASAGKHTIKYWFVDPAVVLERVIVDTGGLKPSYLGPKE